MLKAEDQVEIRELYARYNRALDVGEPAEWVRTFTPDGVFHHPACSYIGPSELARFVIERNTKLKQHPVSRQRHWNDAIVISGNGDRAAGACDLIVAGTSAATGKPEIVACGRYVDELVHTSTGWRFAVRKLAVV